MTANVHLKIDKFTDGDADQIPMRYLVDIFENTGYNGFLVLEYTGSREPEESYRLGVALLRKLLEK